MSRRSVPNVLNPDEEDFEDEEEWTYEYVTDSDEEGAWSDEVSTNMVIDLPERKKEEKPELEEIKEELKKREEARKSEENRLDRKKMDEMRKKEEEAKKLEEKGKKEEEAKKWERKKEDDAKKLEDKRKNEEIKKLEEKRKKEEEAKKKPDPPPKPMEKTGKNIKEESAKMEKEKEKPEKFKKNVVSPLAARKKRESASPVKKELAKEESASPRRSISPVKKDGQRPGRLSLGGKGEPPPPPPKLALASVMPSKKVEVGKKDESTSSESKMPKKEPPPPPEKPKDSWRERKMDREREKISESKKEDHSATDIPRRSASPLKMSSFRNASPVKKDPAAPEPPPKPAKPTIPWAERKERESTSPIKKEAPTAGKQSENIKSSPMLSRKIQSTKPLEALQEMSTESYAKAREALKKTPAKTSFRSVSPVKKETSKVTMAAPEVPQKNVNTTIKEKTGENGKNEVDNRMGDKRGRSSSPMKISAFRNASPVKKEPLELNGKKALDISQKSEAKKIAGVPQTKAESSWAARRKERKSASPGKKDVPPVGKSSASPLAIRRTSPTKAFEAKQEIPMESYSKARDALKKTPTRTAQFRSVSPEKKRNIETYCKIIRKLRESWGEKEGRGGEETGGEAEEGRGSEETGGEAEEGRGGEETGGEAEEGRGSKNG